MMYRPCDRPPPSEIFRSDFVSSVATTETLEGLYRANDGNDVLDDLRKKPTANAISANGKTRLNQHFLGALNSLLREVDMRRHPAGLSFKMMY
jgi:hypothetical protein